MSELTAEQKLLKKELATISGKPQHITIDAIKTKEAYDKAYAEKGIVPTSKRDYPRSGGMGYRAIQRLLQFDSIVHPEKGEIRKVIHSIVVQPVTVDKQKKYAIYFHGSYVGLDGWGSEIGCPFSEGYYLKPKLLFVVNDVGNPFDPKTGERKGTWQPAGYTYEHTIFVPENPKERRKFIENLTKHMDLSTCVYSYRVQNHDNNHQSIHGQISRENLCDLTFDQLEQLQTKCYYKDNFDSLRDKDNLRVQYDPSTKKVESLEGR